MLVAPRGVASVYLLGVFSGAASSCCAPVLAGIAVLSGAAGSFPVAIAISLTYVAGMVAPLALVAVLWERRDWSSSRWLHGREFTVGLFGMRRRFTLGTVAAGVLLVAMGVLTIVIAFTGPGMGNRGWRVAMAADLQHWAAITTRTLSWLPGWIFALLLAAAVVLLARQLRSRPRTSAAPSDVRNEVEAAPVDDSPQLSAPTIVEAVRGGKR